MAGRRSAAGGQPVKTLIVSDVHANLAALEAVLDTERSWDRFVFLGDAVLAGPQPDEVLSLLREVADVCLMGNHDREILSLDADQPAENPGRSWARWHKRSLSRRNLEFLGGFLSDAVLEEGDRRIRLVHGDLPAETGGRLYPDSPPHTFAYLADRYSEPWLMFGHSHVQFEATRHGRRFINPGSAGTAYVGHPLSCYAVLDDGNLMLKAASYEVERTCACFEERGQGIVDESLIRDWTAGWRTGTVPARYNLRDFTSLHEQGYR
jgi:putative phosphoesterase